MDLESISSESINKEIAYLLGVYLTDGYLGKDNSFSLQVIDKDFAEQTLSCIKKLIPPCIANVYIRTKCVGWSKKQQYCLHAKFSEFADFFRKQTGNKSCVPYVLWDASWQIKKWFIAGIMDGDGYISFNNERIKKNGLQYLPGMYKIGLGKSESGWILDFRLFLQSNGVDVGKIQRTLTKNNIPFINFYFTQHSFIESGLFFTLKRKQNRVKKLIDARSETKGSASHGMKI